MTDRIVLTIAQARTLQRSNDPWPGDWATMLIPQREKEDAKMDDARAAIGLAMKTMGCGDDQIVEQLGWKADGGPIKQINRMYGILARG